MDPESIRERVAAVQYWWHSIEVGGGVITPGFKGAELLVQELENLRLPDLNGKRVLDIGAWDGFFSLACEREGAGEVVALDHHVWNMDLRAYGTYRDECIRTGANIVSPELIPEYWQPDRLPGKAGFDTAISLLGSKVSAVVGNFMEMELEPIGQFDVVLYLGVLYHIADPFLALRRLACVTRELAIIETEATVLPAYPDASLAVFHPFAELNDDPTNWWVPTLRALSDMCLAAGFSEVEATVAPPTVLPQTRLPFGLSRPGAPLNYRLIVHARK